MAGTIRRNVLACWVNTETINLLTDQIASEVAPVLQEVPDKQAKERGHEVIKDLRVSEGAFPKPDVAELSPS